MDLGTEPSDAQPPESKVNREQVLYVTTRSPLHQESARLAAPSDCDVTMLRNPTQQELHTQIGKADYLISERSGEIDQFTIAAGKKLRLIQRLGSLTHDIDLVAATDAGVPVCIWPLKGCVLVAEHLLMQMLVLAKRLPEAMAAIVHGVTGHQDSKRTDENTFAYNWTGRAGVDDLYGKQIGILGFGEIGVEFARRMAGFQSTVWYNKRNRLPAHVEQMLGLSFTQPDNIYAQCDYVCSLLPYSQNTDLSIDATAFARMKMGAFFVSCGSGSVVDEEALADAIESGHLAGAALDTFEWEPLPLAHRLVRLAQDPSNNVLLTPHIAAGTDASERGEEYTNVMRIRAGQPLLHQVNLPNQSSS